MVSSMSKKWLQCMAAACLALSAGLANAGAFVTRWDPEFNVGFTNTVGDLGWRGEAIVSVPDSCITQGGTTSISVSTLIPWIGTCPSSSLNLDSLDLTFYDVSSGANLVPTFHLVNPSTEIVAVESVSGGVTGIITFPWLSFNDVSIYGRTFDFWLIFTFDGPILKAQQDCHGGSSSSYVTMMSGSKMKCDRTLYVSGNPSNPNDPTAPKVTWAAVPEPGSLTLLSLSLGAFGLVLGRRRRTAQI